MRKHIKWKDFAARSGNTIPLVITQVEIRPATAPGAPAKSGKLNYQGKRKTPPPAPPQIERVKKKIPAQGRYIGDGKQLTAFVWLEEAPDGEAANDARNVSR